jgi:hypothetical protein
VLAKKLKEFQVSEMQMESIKAKIAEYVSDRENIYVRQKSKQLLTRTWTTGKEAC